MQLTGQLSHQEWLGIKHHYITAPKGAFLLPKLGGYMQEHEKTLLTLIVIGGLIGMSKLLVSPEKLTFRVIIGRTILGSASSLVAGLVLLQIPDISPLALVGIGSALGILGSTFIEEYLKKNARKWGA